MISAKQQLEKTVEILITVLNRLWEFPEVYVYRSLNRDKLLWEKLVEDMGAWHQLLDGGTRTQTWTKDKSPEELFNQMYSEVKYVALEHLTPKFDINRIRFVYHLPNKVEQVMKLFNYNLEFATQMIPHQLELFLLLLATCEKVAAGK